jgi:hypothetical protein
LSDESVRVISNPIYEKLRFLRREYPHEYIHIFDTHVVLCHHACVDLIIMAKPSSNGPHASLHA